MSSSSDQDPEIGAPTAPISTSSRQDPVIGALTAPISTSSRLASEIGMSAPAIPTRVGTERGSKAHDFDGFIARSISLS